MRSLTPRDHRQLAQAEAVAEGLARDLGWRTGEQLASERALEHAADNWWEEA